MRFHQLLVFTCVVMTGCTIGNGRICGFQTPAIDCDKAAYERLQKPYVEKWQKLGMTVAQRDQDTLSCGSVIAGPGAPSFTRAALQAEEKPGDDLSDDAFTRLHRHWQRCMLKKGYHYTGDCSGKTSTPACGTA